MENVDTIVHIYTKKNLGIQESLNLQVTLQLFQHNEHIRALTEEVNMLKNIINSIAKTFHKEVGINEITKQLINDESNMPVLNCEQCEFKTENTVTLQKRINTRHMEVNKQDQNQEIVKKHKFSCNECSFTSPNKKVIKKHMNKEHTKTNNRKDLNNDVESNIQISSMAVSDPKANCTICDDDTCNSCLSYWLAKAKEISMGLAIS